MIVFGTGHRPEDLDLSVRQLQFQIETELACATTPIETIIAGFASGFDLALALAAIGQDMNLVLARPWAGHKPRLADRDLYDEILAHPNTHVSVVNDSVEYPGASVYHERNRWMVDRANAGIAWWSGKESGGTFACLQYAKKVGKPVHNIFTGPNLVH